MENAAPTILVLVGTDHHAFDRLIDWAEAWSASHPHHRVTVQHGSTAPPATARAIAFFEPDELRIEATRSDVVITHGGPGTITDARRAGHLPLVFARDPNVGEHVDDHQLRFARWASERGLIDLCATTGALSDAVAAGLDSEDGTRVTRESADEATASGRHLATLLTDFDRAVAPTATDAPLVVYLGASVRSGSLLLERLLDAMPHVVALGEVNHLWHGATGNDYCSCGEHLGSCSFWQRVGLRAFDGWSNVDVDRLRALRNAVGRLRRIPYTARRRTSRDIRAQILEYSSHFRAIYEAVRDDTGAKVIVDSSRHAALALALSHDRHIDLRVLHITHDSRSIAYAATRAASLPRTPGFKTMMSPLRSTVGWVSHNLSIEGVRRRRIPVARIRYEDLVDSPRSEIQRAWHELSLPEPVVARSPEDDSAGITPTHSVSATPASRASTRTMLKPDTQWQQHMPAWERRIVTVLSLPLLLRFRYSLWRRKTLPATQLSRATPSADGAYQPKVSVVIATRSRPIMVREAIASVRAQSYAGFVETIVVHDQTPPDQELNDTDETRPVRAIANGNTPGLPGARNSGIAAAVGEIIAFCDDDDYWLPDKLGQQVARLEDDAVDVVSCGIRVEHAHRIHDRVLDRDRITFDDLLRNRHTEVHPSTFVMRRSTLEQQIGGIDEDVPGGFGEDYEFLLRAAQYAPIANVAEVYTVVRWSGESYFFRRWQTMRDGLTWLLSRYPEFESSPAGSARIRAQISFANASLGERTEAMKWASSALRRNPLEPRTALAIAVALRFGSPDRVMTWLHRLGKGI